MYKILFIDEQQDDIDNFKDYIEEKDSGSEFEVVSLFPLENLDDMVEEVISMHADSIVTDFMLNEYKEDITYNVPYNGTDLIQRIIAEREGYPCFVMTSFDDEAVGENDDVNIVYIKGILHGNEKDTRAKATFFDRVKSQIIHYRAKIEKAEDRLLELKKKSGEEKLNAPEEEEMISLDEFIEKSLDKKFTVPKVAKGRTESDSLTLLLKKVDELTEKLEKKS